MESRFSKRVGIYARVSTTGHGQDPDLQVQELRQVAEQRGWRIVETYIDNGESGKKSSRPALNRLMADARARKFDLVAVSRFDRFARDTAHLLHALEEFRMLGIDFVSVRESIDTSTPLGKAIFTIIAAIAELERELIRERVLVGVRRARELGKHCGRPRKELDLRPALALLKEGRGLKEVASILRVPRATLRRRLREAGQWGITQPGLRTHPENAHEQSFVTPV